MDQLSLGISVETVDQTGEILAIYFSVRRGKVKTTKEAADGKVFLDYDKDGRLLGIEMLSPCEISVIDRISKNSRVRKFVKESIPRSMLVTT
jgi:uncharacterized protein YuzE